jgi:hypothetical protein
MDESRDHLEKRCPRLGGPVTFNYCRLHGGDEPICWKILDCWWEIFDVATFLKEQLSPEEFSHLGNAQSKPKVASLIELIDQAKKRANRES